MGYALLAIISFHSHWFFANCKNAIQILIIDLPVKQSDMRSNNFRGILSLQWFCTLPAYIIWSILVRFNRAVP